MRFFARLLVVVAIPIFLVLTNVRIVMNEWYVRWEYAKPNFPPAVLLPPELRYRAAVTTVDYVRGASPVEAITELGDGTRLLYNEREIRHLVDVRNVVDMMFYVHIASILLIVLGAFYLAQRQGRNGLLRALRGGGWLTIGLLVGLGLAAILNFDWFFTKFHQLFFQGDTWLFDWTDTLIQLYPLPFWFDIVMLLAAMTIGEALLISLLGWFGLNAGRSAARLQPSRRSY